MKINTIITIGLCASLASGFATGRTWTSSDGSKAFEGDFESWDEVTNKVTVRTQGQSMTFSTSIISEDDQAWVKSQPSKQDLAAKEEAAAEFGESKLGKALAKAKILEDKKYVDFAYETAPEYFILYFTASW